MAASGTKFYLQTMMLKHEWLQKAQTPELGDYALSEATELRQSWIEDDHVSNDHGGPRRFQRCEVVIGHFGEKFNLQQHQKRLAGEMQKSKKPTEDQLQGALAKLSLNHNTFEGVLLNSCLEDLSSTNALALEDDSAGGVFGSAVAHGVVPVFWACCSWW